MSNYEELRDRQVADFPDINLLFMTTSRHGERSWIVPTLFMAPVVLMLLAGPSTHVQPDNVMRGDNLGEKVIKPLITQVDRVIAGLLDFDSEAAGPPPDELRIEWRRTGGNCSNMRIESGLSEAAKLELGIFGFEDEVDARAWEDGEEVQAEEVEGFEVEVESGGMQEEEYCDPDRDVVGVEAEFEGQIQRGVMPLATGSEVASGEN